ncbi:sodium/hydrogen exchanger family-like protein [Aureococcus anophagefferens]|nr:sodium/hydrogen exchanger family-like protein [Aureococcus anophagefferens]
MDFKSLKRQRDGKAKRGDRRRRRRRRRRGGARRARRGARGRGRVRRGRRDGRRRAGVFWRASSTTPTRTRARGIDPEKKKAKDESAAWAEFQEFAGGVREQEAHDEAAEATEADDEYERRNLDQAWYESRLAPLLARADKAAAPSSEAAPRLQDESEAPATEDSVVALLKAKKRAKKEEREARLREVDDAYADLGSDDEDDAWQTASAASVAPSSNIIIPDPKELEKKLPTYFRHEHYSSFQRQLNNFGYNKLHKSSSPQNSVYVRIKGDQLTDMDPVELLQLRPVLERPLTPPTAEAASESKPQCPGAPPRPRPGSLLAHLGPDAPPVALLPALDGGGAAPPGFRDASVLVPRGAAAGGFAEAFAEGHYAHLPGIAFHRAPAVASALAAAGGDRARWAPTPGASSFSVFQRKAPPAGAAGVLCPGLYASPFPGYAPFSIVAPLPSRPHSPDGHWRANLEDDDVHIFPDDFSDIFPPEEPFLL